MNSLMTPIAAYIHIPFCRRRCFYCDFPIAVLGNKTDINHSSMIKEYVNVLCQEIKLYSSANIPLQTLFFGGGTPSLLPVKQLEKILKAINDAFGIEKNAEISMEIDPATFNLEQLKGYYQLGVNRFSLGAQAFQDDLLNVCGRWHKVKDIFIAVDLLNQLNITNFSLDLISGLPHQTLQQWEQSLKEAIALSPVHLSCYDLVLEPVTAFGKQYQPGLSPLPDDDTTANFYRLASQFLRDTGYEHYEISNYSQPKYQCQHNRVYWQNKPFYGFGMGATSYLNNIRFKRPHTRASYAKWVRNGSLIEHPPLTKTDRLLETLMLGLRLKEGVNLGKIEDDFGEIMVKKIINTLKPYIKQGWVTLSPLNTIALRDPEGFLFSNVVLTALFEVLS
ncbi:MAG: radical SAM family heme chaperone HemW [Microcystaceae cyanobacterium]